MPDTLHIADFLDPIHVSRIASDEPYHDGQLGKLVAAYETEFPDLEYADVVLVGCGDQRGSGPLRNSSAPDVVRTQLYRMYHWHTQVRIADIGNVKTGASLDDTYAALKTICRELRSANKPLVILGGSHDLMLAQYHAFANDDIIIEAACVDALINLDMNSPAASDHFLMEMLTGEPNYIRHYNHIGFQSYYVHPHMLETLDKLRFDCYRVGKVRDNMEEMEPVIRHCNLFSFDISAIANGYAPASTLSPNGFTGEEACALMRYAGMSAASSVGIYGFHPEADLHNLTAKQIAQMVWYYVEGKSRSLREAAIQEKEAFNEYHLAFAEVETTFLQSKRTGRWWMQLPDRQYIACSYNDYIQASSNEVPERWLRAQERSV